MNPFPGPPVLGFAAWSGTGKTTLLVKLLPLLGQAGLRVGVIKHAHHRFDIDQPGKDSHRLREAGAGQMLVASAQRWALMVENPAPAEPQLAELLTHMDTANLDLILVEGFRHETFPKLELHRAVLGKPLLYPQDRDVIAVASDMPLVAPVPVLDINDPPAVAAFVSAFAAGKAAQPDNPLLPSR